MKRSRNSFGACIILCACAFVVCGCRNENGVLWSKHTLIVRHHPIPMGKAYTIIESFVELRVLAIADDLQSCTLGFRDVDGGMEERIVSVRRNDPIWTTHVMDGGLTERVVEIKKDGVVVGMPRCVHESNLD